MDDLTSHDDRLPYCDCHACALFERNRLRAELDACETELRTVRTSQAESNAEIERLRAELAACREDAERYRWLREHWDDVNHPVDFIICNSFVTTLDADVDAARKGEVET